MTKQQDDKIKKIKSEVYTFIADEVIKNGEEFDSDETLLVLGSIQSVLVEIYKEKLGPEKTAMFYYSVADRMIE